MHPKEFIAKWHLTRQELAQLTGKSADTVYHWFVEGSSQRAVPPDVTNYLCLLDAVWTQRQTLEQRLPAHINALYELSRSRQSQKSLS
ncbi:hypothetical protein [Microseira wollei]|uniref:hypothetical protein n=1 Tax=Microseira wollei TaxID=467598 RepID=UPI001CFF53FC|nr:hypothetical protein [Microseira wollei]